MTGTACFKDHGVASPFSNHRGIVATTDGNGRNVVLAWLFDCRGCTSLLVIDAETGTADEVPIPFRNTKKDCPFSSLLSSRNRFYSHFGDFFVEFDPERLAFTFCRETTPQVAMGMTEDDAGRVWSVTYPDSGLVCYDPAIGAFKDYGSVHAENWPQYQRSVAADETGWVYFAVGNTASQIVAFDPERAAAFEMLPEHERRQGTAKVFRAQNGRVYGTPDATTCDTWIELRAGKPTVVAALPPCEEKPIITSSQALFHRVFPDGKQVVDCDLVERCLIVEDPGTGQRRELAFDYHSEGAHLMGLAAAPDGTICGGTAFPMRFFSYDPRDDRWVNRKAYGQFNTVARQGDRFFVGGYIHGYLLEWDPAREWVDTEKDNPECNPRFLTDCEPTINRPHALLAHPDGNMVVLAGTPGYGYTGGGLLFWDRAAGTRVLLEHTDILPEHSTMSLAALRGGKLLGGSTVAPGTGGEPKAEVAELYIMDMATKRLEWHAPVLPGVQGYLDLHVRGDGLVYGLADATDFFVFDPVRCAVIHHERTADRLGDIHPQQGPRKLLSGPEGGCTVLFRRGIAAVDPSTFEIQMVAEAPVPVEAGGDIVDGTVYFGSGSHLWSCRLSGPSESDGGGCS